MVPCADSANLYRVAGGVNLPRFAAICRRFCPGPDRDDLHGIGLCGDASGIPFLAGPYFCLCRGPVFWLGGTAEWFHPGRSASPWIDQYLLVLDLPLSPDSSEARYATLAGNSPCSIFSANINQDDANPHTSDQIRNTCCPKRRFAI